MSKKYNQQAAIALLHESFETLANSDLDTLAAGLRYFHDIKEIVNNSRKGLVQDTPGAGKVMAAFKRKYAEMVDKGAFPKGTSFAEYFQNVFGMKPDGKVEQCAACFNGYVLSDLISEKDYDLCAADWLQKASTVLKLCNNDLKSDHVKNAATILEERGKDGAKKLRHSIAELKGTIVDANGKTLNADDVAEQVSSFLKNGFGTLVLTCVKTHVKDNVRNADSSEQKDLYQASQSIMHQWEDAGIDARMIINWFEDWDKKQQQHTVAVVPKPDYREIAIRFYGEMDDEMLSDVAKEIEGYHLAMKRLPKDTAEFDAYMEQEPEAASAAA